MGNSEFLSTISDKKITIDQSLLNCSSSKLREYYSSYKSICESFSITISEFIQIFGHNQKAFQAFDPKNKGRIDAIQMFTGLIIFSSINYQQKIKFLFEIFDFNQEGWLSYQALTFLLINACNSTYKILSLQQTVNSKEIQAFLNQYFYQESEIPLEKFIKWSRRIEQFMSFFNIIEHDFQPYFQLKKIDKLKSGISKEKCLQYKQEKNFVQLKGFYEFQRFGNPLHTFLSKKVIKDQTEKSIKPQRFQDPNSIFDNQPKRDKGKDSELLKQDAKNIEKQIKEAKKISKTNYKINFEFDNKFIEVLQSLVAPYEEKNNSESFNIKKERGAQKQVNFNFSNQDYEKDEDQIEEDDENVNIDEQKFNPSLKWLYGINLSIPNPVKFLQTSDPKASNEIFIYSLNHTIILYYHKINIQKHYIHHKNPISAFQISHNKNYIASADFGEDFDVDFPQIHIWRIKDRKPIIKWKNLQKGKIHKLAWSRKDRNIVSISYFEGKWAVKIIDLMTKNVMLSTYINESCILISRNLPDNEEKLTPIHPLEFIDILQCKKVKKSKSKVYSQPLIYFVIYTYNSVTLIYPNDQVEQNITNSEQSTALYREFSMVTKLLSESQSFLNQVNRLNHLFPQNSSKIQKSFPSLLCLLEYEGQKFIGVHNDKKIRIWDKDFQNYQTFYTRRQSQKSFFQVLLYQVPEISINTQSQAKNDQIQQIHKKTRTSLIQKHKQLCGQAKGHSGQKTRILVILDEQKIQLLNMSTKETKFIQIPDSLYNLMLINIELIQTRKKETQFILVSLFGDVIRVLGVGSLLQGLAGHRNQDKNIFGSSKNNKSNKSKSSGKIQATNTSRKQLFQEFKHSQNSNSQDSSQHSYQRIGPVEEVEKKVTFKKYYQIFYLQKCKDYYFYDEYCLIIADKLIYKINSDEKELATLMSFDHQLKAISGFGSYFALLTQHVPQYVFILQNDQVYEKIKLAYHISTIKLIPTHLILCEQKFIQVYTKSYEKYLTGDSKRTPIDGSLPIDICSTQNPFKFIIVTQERQVFHLEIKNNEFRYKKVKSSQMMSSQGYNSQGYSTNMVESYLEIAYPHLNDSFSMIFYPQQKFLSIGMSNGDVRVWVDLKRIKNNKEACKEYYELLRHQGPVKKMRLRFYESELQFVTLGQKDGMIAVYNHFDYLIGDKEKPTSKELLYYLEQQQKFNPYLDQIAFNLKQFTQTTPSNSDTFKHSISLLKDSQIQISMFDEPLQPWIRDIITKIVYPNTSNYESLSGQNQLSRANLVSLEIDHIYGFLSERVRNSVGYVHHYGTANQYEHKYVDEMMEESENGKRKGLEQAQKEVESQLAFSHSTLLPLNEEHENCKREVIYFIDRLVILFNPETRKQRVYSFHKSQVSTFQIHPSKFLVCSAQKAISNPTIHIWDSESLVLKKSITTKHKGGSIFKIEFSREGTYVLTLAGHCEDKSSSMMDKAAFLMSSNNYSSLGINTNNTSTMNTNGMFGGYSNLEYISVQIIEWKYSNSILYRVLLQEVILAVKFNPYCETEICFGGRDCLKIYSFETGNLVIKENLEGFGQTITTLVYSSALYGTDIESDIIVGTMDGNAALYICGKLIKIKKIHEGSINFISLNQLFKYKTILITAAQDSIVKIWDTKFNMLATLNVRHQLLVGKHINEYTSYNFSAQSIDFFSCYPQRITQALNNYVFLLGTRSGHVLECKISSEYQGLKEIEDKKVSFVKEKLSLEVKVLLNNNNFINGGTQFQICGQRLMLSYSINSTVVFLWNYKKKELINFYKLKGCPSLVKYDQNSNRVFFGYFKHSEIEVYKMGEDDIAYLEEFPIKNDYYPDNIIFNSVNNYIAISLVLAVTISDNTNPSTNSCIEIYEYKDSWKTTTQTGKKEYEQKWRIDHANKKKGTVLSFGISSSVWMGFSASGQQLLVLYSEKRIHLGHHTSTNSKFLKDQPFALRDTYLLETLMSTQHAQKISKNSEFVMYSIAQKKQKEYTHEDFIELNFFPFIKVHYLYYDKMNFVSNQGNNNGHLSNENMNNNQLANLIGDSDLLHPLVSQMVQYQKFIILGTTAGQVLFINSDFFCSSHKKNSKSSAICKYFKIFSTPITRMCIKSDRLFVCSSKNNSILNIKIVHNENLTISSQLNDEFNQKITGEYLQKLVKTIFPKRQYIYESRLSFFDNENLPKISQNQSPSPNSQSDDEQIEQNYKHQEQLPKNKKKIHLQLYSAIGRNAIYKRNNIFVDLRQNIISHTGCNLLILKRSETKTSPQNYLSVPASNTNTTTINFLTHQKVAAIEERSRRNNYNQEFLKLDVSPFSTFAEISCISMSEDRRVIVAGTNEENAKILVWDISTKTNLKQISLKNMISIVKLGISASNQRIALIALNKKGESILFFIQVTEQNILAAYSFSSQHESINDIKFFPQSEFSFLLCGNNYMAEWNYNGILTFQPYNIENPSDFIQIADKNPHSSQTHNSNQNHPKKNQSQVIFYSLSFLKNILISAGSDGYLYIWNDKTIIKKQNAHPKSAILCLYASSSSKIFASGGADGKAIVWQLSSSSIIQKIFEFSIYHGRQQKIPVRYHIQSVCISKNNIIVGTRAGEIYEFMCNDIQEIEKMKEEWKKGVNLILPAYDDDMINSISFNTSSEKLFMITQMGYFSVFDIETLEKIKEEKIDIGKSDIIKMIACKLSYRIIIVLKNSVLIYYYWHNKEEKVQKFRKGKENFKSENNSFIKNAIMSSNQKYLALLIASAQMDLYSIQLYDLTQVEGSFFKQSKILDHIPTNVQVIDFSTDNEYLICKNTEDQETIVHLSTHETINPNSIEFELQYSDQAKKTSKNIRDILQVYGEENQLLKIAQVMNHSIIATDEMGSIRIFQYPIIGGNNLRDKMDVSYYRFYVQHLNEVYLCVLSQDCRILATVGREDRTLFLWKVREV